MMTAFSSSPLMMIAARKGAITPVKYLQNEFFPVKAALIKGDSPPASGVLIVSLTSI
jgi:hypothetical protein